MNLYQYRSDMLQLKITANRAIVKKKNGFFCKNHLFRFEKIIPGSIVSEKTIANINFIR